MLIIILFKSLFNFAISDDLKVQSRFGYYNHVEKRIVESAGDRRVRTVFLFIPQKEGQERWRKSFVDLFYEDQSAEANMISLYQALHEEPLPEGTVIEKINVGDAIYMNLKNDISFGAAGKARILYLL